VQSPEIFLNDLGITVNCVVDPARQALLDEKHRVFVNWETYYLSSDENLATFRADPLKYVGTVTDPVTRERFRPDSSHRRLDHEGRVIYFRNPENVARFQAGPEAYIPPMLGMQGE
jgi:YHS domain-containing protein